MIHKIHLYFLKKWLDFMLFIGMTALITTLILVFASLVQIHRQSARNEQILKGLSCILLILPEQRTQEKVSNCIKFNGSGESNFMFKTIQDSTKETDKISALPIGNNKTLYVVPVKGDQGPQGEQGPKGDTGQQGQPGVSIKGDKGDTVTIQGLDGKDGAQGEPGSSGREVEFQYNEAAKRIEWRYVGDDGWQILINQCQLLGTCEAP